MLEIQVLQKTYCERLQLSERKGWEVEWQLRREVRMCYLLRTLHIDGADVSALHIRTEPNAIR